LVSPTSYENVRSKWFLEVNHHVPSAAIVLAGNKLDLRNNPEIIQKLKDKNLTPITTEQGLKRAEEIGAKAYIEFSALTGENINKVFESCYSLWLSAGIPKPKREKCVMQ